MHARSRVCGQHIYGSGVRALSEKTGVDMDEVRRLLKAWDRLHPGAIEWIDRARAECRKCGYVETLSRRRRYIPNAQSAESDERAKGERQVYRNARPL